MVTELGDENLQLFFHSFLFCWQVNFRQNCWVSIFYFELYYTKRFSESFEIYFNSFMLNLFLFHVIDQIIIIPSWYDFRNFSIIRILFLTLVKCLPIPKEFDLVLFPTPETFWNKKHWWTYNIMTQWNIFQPRQLTLNCMFSNNTIMIFISWVLYKSR